MMIWNLDKNALLSTNQLIFGKDIWVVDAWVRLD